MSIVCVQLGQCGNQLGNSFYDFLINECQNASPAAQATLLDTFFYQKEEKSGNIQNYAKSLLIDMEPKVVQSCLNSHKNDVWQFDPSNSFTQQEGSGNNWAYGYNVHGLKCRDKILQIFQKLLEEIDFCEGIFLLQSLAGGTGSGLGSFILEMINDEYPELNKMNVCVAPHLTGEVILQSYNCVLTITSLYQNTDGIILIENDGIEEICNKLLNLKRPSLTEMNRVIAHQLSSVLFPVLPESQKNSSGQQQSVNYFSSLQNNFRYFNDIYDLLLTDPRYKILSIKNVPQMPDASKSFQNDQWSALEKRIFQMQISNSMESNINWSKKIDSGIRSLGNILIGRGIDVQKQKFEMFAEPQIYKNQRVNYRYYKDSHQFNNNEKSISMISNSQFCVEPLSIISNRAHQMYREKAYLYQYEKYGISQEEFFQSLAMFDQILFNYQSI
ncbi:hypothetical protein ABPG74_015648 [Tetrahymena malaccensis]